MSRTAPSPSRRLQTKAVSRFLGSIAFAATTLSAGWARAQTTGTLMLDSAFYNCADSIEIEVNDADLIGAMMATVTVASTSGDSETVALNETPADSGVFTGSIPTLSVAPTNENGVLEVADADGITVTYADAAGGEGGPANVVAMAAVDCSAPTFAGLEDAEAGDGQVELSWSAATDASPVAYNIYRATSMGGQDFMTPLASTQNLEFTDLSAVNGTTYFYVVRAEDAAGNEDSNSVERSARPIGPLDHFAWDAITSPQLKNVPFDVKVTAKDADENDIEDFRGKVMLSAELTSPATEAIVITDLRISPGNDGVEIMNVGQTTVDIGDWTITFYDTAAFTPSTSLTFPPATLFLPGEVFTIIENSDPTADFPLAFSLVWGGNFAVLLQDDVGAIVDFVTSGDSSLINDPVSIPSAQWSGPGVPSVTSNSMARIGRQDNNDASDWQAAGNNLGSINPLIETPFAELLPVAISPIESAFFIDGMWVGQVTVHEEGDIIALIADDGAGHDGVSNNFTVVAQPGRGVVTFDRDFYACGATVTIALIDEDLIGNGMQNVVVTAAMSGDSETVALTETPPNSGTFTATIPLAASGAMVVGEDGVVQASDFDTLTVTYMDADDGLGDPATVTDTAQVDCVAPMFDGLDAAVALDGAVMLTWNPATDDSEPIEYAVLREEAPGFALTVSLVEIARVGDFHYLDTGVTNGVTYNYLVHAIDAAGNQDVNNVILSARPIGPVDRFNIDTIASPQFFNTPFDVTIAAVDATDATVLDYAGTAALTALAADPNATVLISEVRTSPGNDGVELTNVGVATVDIGDWTIAFYDSAAFTPTASLTFPSGSMVAPGQVVSIIENNDGTADFPLPASLNWGTTFAVLLRDSGGAIVDFVTSGDSSLVTSPVSIPAEHWSGPGVTIAIASARRGDNADTNTNADWTQGAQNIGTLNAELSIPFASAIALDPLTADPFVNGVSITTVTIGELAAGVTIVADDGAGTTGVSNAFDVVPNPSTGQLSFDSEIYACGDTVNVEFFDIDLAGSGIFMIAVTTGAGDSETIILTEDMAMMGRFTGSIVIDSSGAPVAADGVLQGADFDTIESQYMDADDGFGSPQTVTATATLDCAAPVFGGVESAEKGNQRVRLSWSAAVDDTSVKYNVYRSTSPGGQNFSAPIGMTTDLTFDDEPTTNGVTFHYVVRAQDAAGNEENNVVEASAMPSGEVVSFEFDPIASPQLLDGDFSVTVRALACAGTLASDFVGTVTLAATDASMNPVAFTPAQSPNFVASAATFNVTVMQAASGVRLTADDGEAHTGQSNAFDVVQDPSMGQIFFDLPFYRHGEMATITLIDSDLAGLSTFTVFYQSQLGDSETFPLFPIAPGSFTFQRTLPIAPAGSPPTAEDDTIQAGPSDTISVSYFDQQPGPSVRRTATALVDSAPPQFDGVQSAVNGDMEATLSWNAAIDPATPFAYHVYRSTTPGGQNFGAPPVGTTMDLNFTDTGLTNGATYYYVVRAEDAAGNVETNTVEFSATPRADLDRFEWAPIASPQSASIPFDVQITAVDREGGTFLEDFGAVSLSASNSGPIAILPTETGDFVDGVWTGQINVLQAATGVTLTADNGDGISGSSNAFDALCVPPVITVQFPLVACVGTTPTLQLTLSQGALPVAWELLDGPEGMTIDPVTGVLTWSGPQVEDDGVSVTVRATNDCGMDEMTFMPAVVEPPIVTLQPSDQAVRQGQSVTLAAVASGLGDVTYQWFMGEPGSGAPVSGVLPLPADGIASFGLGQVDFSDAGEYFVVVTSPCGQEVVSESASLGILFSAANSAQLVSHDFPTFMSPGETATVTIVLRNNSTVTWSDSQGYRLGVTADAGGFFGGTTRLPILGFNPPPVSEAGAGSLPPGDATMVVPVGGEAIFAATIAAPMTVGAFTIDIRMAEDPSAVFPALSLNPLLRATIAVGVDRVDFTSGGGDAAGWTGGAPTGFGGTTTVTAAGICLTAPGPGENLPLWVSPSNLAPLVANTVYKLRVTLSTDQTAVDSIPLLNFSYDNFQISNGFLNFGGERWIWDTGGGANGIGRAAGRTTYTFAFAPVSLALPQWNGQVSPESSAFTAEADQRNDLRLAFRVIDISVDVDGDGVIEPEDGDSDPLGALADSGTICIESIVLEIMPLADMLAAATPISSTPLNDGSNVPGMEDPASPDRTHFAQSSLNLTNFPTVQADIMDGHWRVRLPQIDAASDPNGAGFVRATLGPDVVAAGPLQINDPNGGGAGVPGLVQNPLRLFPVLWEQDAIYTVRAAIASDEAAETADPINLITLNFETYTAELGGVDFVTSGAFGQPGGMFLAGSPRRTQTTGGVTPSYMTFFHGNNATASLIQNANRWKAQVDVFNRSDLAGGPGSGLDGLRVESLRIDRIDMGGNN